LAEQRHTDLLIDEKRGRAVALSRGLHIVGTGAVLLLAKERGIIERVGDALDQLAAHSYRISPGLRIRLLQKAGEA
jgi:predicted nucleic acid-binding protein